MKTVLARVSSHMSAFGTGALRRDKASAFGLASSARRGLSRLRSSRMFGLPLKSILELRQVSSTRSGRPLRSIIFLPRCAEYEVGRSCFRIGPRTPIPDGFPNVRRDRSFSEWPLVRRWRAGTCMGLKRGNGIAVADPAMSGRLGRLRRGGGVTAYANALGSLGKINCVQSTFSRRVS